MAKLGLHLPEVVSPEDSDGRVSPKVLFYPNASPANPTAFLSGSDLCSSNFKSSIPSPSPIANSYSHASHSPADYSTLPEVFTQEILPEAVTADNSTHHYAQWNAITRESDKIPQEPKANYYGGRGDSEKEMCVDPPPGSSGTWRSKGGSEAKGLDIAVPVDSVLERDVEDNATLVHKDESGAPGLPARLARPSRPNDKRLLWGFSRKSLIMILIALLIIAVVAVGVGVGVSIRKGDHGVGSASSSVQSPVHDNSSSAAYPGPTGTPQREVTNPTPGSVAATATATDATATSTSVPDNKDGDQEGNDKDDDEPAQTSVRTITQDPVTRDAAPTDPVTKDPVTKDPAPKDPVTPPSVTPPSVITQDPVTKTVEKPPSTVIVTPKVVTASAQPPAQVSPQPPPSPSPAKPPADNPPPAPVVTAVSCPADAGTTYTSSGQSFKIQCDVDYTATDLYSFKSEENAFKACIDKCASTNGCTGAGYGWYGGNSWMCWGKSDIKSSKSMRDEAHWHFATLS